MTRRAAARLGLAAMVLACPVSAVAAPIGLAREPRGLGLGFILGEPTGLSAAWRGSGASTYAFAVAWSVPEYKVHVNADYLYQLAAFRDPANPVVEFPIYVGLGPRVRVGEGFEDGQSSLLAIRAPVGLRVQSPKVPVEAFLEIAPVFGLYPSTRMDFDAAIGVRLFLALNIERVEPDPEPTPAP
jgi:hypothetical protein